MSITEIQKRMAGEQKVHEAAIAIRKILDSLEGVELSDDRDAAELAVSLATDE